MSDNIKKRRDGFYRDNSEHSFEKAWEYFKDVIRPGNQKPSNTDKAEAENIPIKTPDRDREMKQLYGGWNE